MASPYGPEYFMAGDPAKRGNTRTAIHLAGSKTCVPRPDEAELRAVYSRNGRTCTAASARPAPPATTSLRSRSPASRHPRPLDASHATHQTAVGSKPNAKVSGCPAKTPSAMNRASIPPHPTTRRHPFARTKPLAPQKMPGRNAATLASGQCSHKTLKAQNM